MEELKHQSFADWKGLLLDSFIPSTVARFGPKQGHTLQIIRYKDIIENPELINRTSVSEFLVTLSRVRVKARHADIIDDLRESFISPDFPNEETDLYSLNLQRGRDHGVGSLKDIREALGLSPTNISQTFAG